MLDDMEEDEAEKWINDLLDSIGPEPPPWWSKKQARDREAEFRGSIFAREQVKQERAKREAGFRAQYHRMLDAGVPLRVCQRFLEECTGKRF
jgi:hypothetical protein